MILKQKINMRIKIESKSDKNNFHIKNEAYELSEIHKIRECNKLKIYYKICNTTPYTIIVRVVESNYLFLKQYE